MKIDISDNKNEMGSRAADQAAAIICAVFHFFRGPVFTATIHFMAHPFVSMLAKHGYWPCLG